MFRTASIALLLVLTALAVLAAPSAAQTNQWSLRFGATAADPDGEFVDRSDDTILSSEADSAYGISFSAEYRFSPRVGVEMGAMAFAEDDLRIRVERDRGGERVSQVRTDQLGFQPYFVGLNFHLARGDRTQVYVGPFLAYVRYQSFGLTFESDDDFVTESIELDDDFGYGVVLGLDIPIGQSNWFVHGNARYLKTELDAGSARADYDPLVATVGFGLRLGG